MTAPQLLELLLALGNEIEDPKEETFLLFSQSIPSQDLGFIDAKAREIEVTFSGRDLCIEQSPGLLLSNREGGTTGAVVWKITPLFAEWITSDNNILFKTCILGRDSQVLELGCGISGIVAIALGPEIGRYIATDQDYVFKLLKSNIEGNTWKQKVTGKAKHREIKTKKSNISIITLDWEWSSVTRLPVLLGNDERNDHFQGFDAIVACDCIYNDALIEPFVRTCADASQLAEASPSERPTVCIIAQQLRSDLVFEAWLSAFHTRFRVWRVPDKLLVDGLRQGSGFVVHVGFLRDSKI